MNCRCDELAARIVALEARLGISQQATLFAGDTAEPGGEARYSPAFEEAWAKTARTGSKKAAFDAWKKGGCPPAAIVLAAWNAYMRSRGPVQLGAVQNVSTWLNQRGWEQRWEPAGQFRTPGVVTPPTATGPTYAPPQSSCFPHGENPRCRTKRITPGCPECKEQAAREAGRMMSEDDVMKEPDWMALAEPIA